MSVVQNVWAASVALATEIWQELELSGLTKGDPRVWAQLDRGWSWGLGIRRKLQTLVSPFGFPRSKAWDQDRNARSLFWRWSSESGEARQERQANDKGEWLSRLAVWLMDCNLIGLLGGHIDHTSQSLPIWGVMRLSHVSLSLPAPLVRPAGGWEVILQHLGPTGPDRRDPSGKKTMLASEVQ